MSRPAWLAASLVLLPILLLLAERRAEAIPLSIYDSANLAAPIGTVETIRTAGSGAAHYDFRSDSTHAQGVNLGAHNSNLWIHENTLTGEFSFGFVFSCDNCVVTNTATFRFRIVDSTTGLTVSVSDDPGEAVQTSPGVFSGSFYYIDNSDGIMVSGINGTHWTVIIEAVDFGNVNTWSMANGQSTALTDDVRLTLGREYRITPASNVVSTVPVDPLSPPRVDSDADGVIDEADLLPCDPAVAAAAFVPAEGEHGLLLFEDLWPRSGDLDFNDLTLSHHWHFLLDARAQVSRIRGTFNVLAAGGTLHNGLALSLPLPRTAVSRVTLETDRGAPVELVPLASEADFTVVLTPDLRALFSEADVVVNSDPALPARGGHVLQLDVELAAPTALDLAQAPFDVFLFRSGDETHQIHRTPYAGTSAMNTARFGTEDDGSTEGRWFVDSSGLPFVLALPEAGLWPQEGVEISALYPDIVTFAASGGAQGAGFYSSNVVASAAWDSPDRPRPGFGSNDQLAADLSCLPVLGRQPTNPAASCLAVMQAGASQGSGVYWLDQDGAGPLVPVRAYCDMVTAGGGWTVIVNNRNDDLEPSGCIPRVASHSSLTCSTLPDPLVDFTVPAWGLRFQELAWVSYNASFTSPTSYAAMRWTTAQTIPSSSGNWVLGASSVVTIPEWSSVPALRCTYQGRTVLRAFGNWTPAAGPYPGVVTLFNQDPSFRSLGNMSFTDHSAWSTTQASMRGVDDFQDGYACNDSWAPQTVRGHASFLMIR